MFPKNRQAWVAKPISEKKSYKFVDDLVLEMKECQQSGVVLPLPKVPRNIPDNIAKEPKLPKEEVIKAHMSRMAKKK